MEASVKKIEKTVNGYLKIWESAKTFGIKVKPSIKREVCQHRNKQYALVDGERIGGKNKNYSMPYCEDCGKAFPTEGRFRCVIIPIST